MNKQIYVVMMHHLGKAEGHSYLLGCWEDIEDAEFWAEREVDDRDGKYDAVVWKNNMNGREKAPVCTFRGKGHKDRIEGAVLV